MINGRLFFALLLICITATFAQAQTKLDYRQRQAVQRQERNAVEIEKRLASGDILLNGSSDWLIKKLDGMEDDLTRAKVPDDNDQVQDLRERIAAARTSLTKGAPKAQTAAAKPATATASSAAPAPKLLPSARAAVDRQWKKIQQQRAILVQLNQEVEKATALKRWDDRHIAYNLQPVMADLDRNHVPKDHPYYIKINNYRKAILEALEKVKAKAAPKVAAYADSVDPGNYPNAEKDLAMADDLAHLYQNVSISQLKDAARGARLLEQAPKAQTFLEQARQTYAPLIESQAGPGRSLKTKLNWLADNLAAFAKVRATFVQQIPGSIEGLLGRADGLIAKAQQERNPAIFTGGVRQALDRGAALLKTYALAQGKDHSDVRRLQGELSTAESKAAKVAKDLEKEILAANRAPTENFSGSGAAEYKQQIRSLWQKSNPGDEILDVRITSKDWQREAGYNWNDAASAWIKFDRQWLQFGVIVKTDGQVATVYPAFLNHDNISGRDEPVTSHQSTYEIRKVLLQNL